MTTILNCRYCNKKLSSYNNRIRHEKICKVRNTEEGLLNFKKFYENGNTESRDIISKYQCKYCNKNLSRIQNLRDHEKICEVKKAIENHPISQLNIDQSQHANTINNGTINNINNTNNTNNNDNSINYNITLCPFGMENLDKLISLQDLERIFNNPNPFEAIKNSIKHVHIDNELYRNIVITNLNNNIIHVYTGDCDKFSPGTKKIVLKQLVSSHIQNIEEKLNNLNMPNEYKDNIKDIVKKHNRILPDNVHTQESYDIFLKDTKEQVVRLSNDAKYILYTYNNVFDCKNIS